MGLVDVLSKETQEEMVAMFQQIAKTAAALELLAKNIDADRAMLRERTNRILDALKRP